MADFHGRPLGDIEPLVGAIRTVRGFLIGPDGALTGPVRSQFVWGPGDNTAGCSREDHRVPDEACTCGFYSYGSVVWGINGGFLAGAPVTAVVECYGQVVAGTKGIRAEHARIVALAFDPLITTPEQQAAVQQRYPRAVCYPDRDAMLAAVPLSVLETYATVADTPRPSAAWPGTPRSRPSAPPPRPTPPPRSRPSARPSARPVHPKASGVRARTPLGRLWQVWCAVVTAIAVGLVLTVPGLGVAGGAVARATLVLVLVALGGGLALGIRLDDDGGSARAIPRPRRTTGLGRQLPGERGSGERVLWVFAITLILGAIALALLLRLADVDPAIGRVLFAALPFAAVGAGAVVSRPAR